MASRVAKYQIDLHIYSLMDKDDNVWHYATDEPGYDTMVYGLYDEDGDLLYFESEAYHLEKWAKENGLHFFQQDVTIPIEVKWV